MMLPGRCQGCGAVVHWNGRAWRDVGVGKARRHVCPVERPLCGAWMPRIRERCARGPGHAYEHRSEYALDNACRTAHHRGVGVSDAPNHESTGLPLTPVVGRSAHLARSKSA